MRFYRDFIGRGARRSSPASSPSWWCRRGGAIPGASAERGHVRRDLVLHGSPTSAPTRSWRPLASSGRPWTGSWRCRSRPCSRHSTPPTARVSSGTGEGTSWRSSAMRRLPSIVRHGSSLPTPLSTMHMYPIDGAAPGSQSRRRRSAIAESRWAQVIVGVDPDPGKAEELRCGPSDYWEALHPVFRRWRLRQFHDGRGGSQRVRDETATTIRAWPRSSAATTRTTPSGSTRTLTGVDRHGARGRIGPGRPCPGRLMSTADVAVVGGGPARLSASRSPATAKP